MPLKRGISNATRNKNIAVEIKSGKPVAQAAAIGYSEQREAEKKEHKPKEKK